MIRISGQTEYQLQARRNDMHGVHTVASGETLSKLIKVGQKLNIPAR